MKRRHVGAAVAGMASVGAYATVVRPWFLRWGATDDEVAREWPGDALSPDAPVVATRAVTVEAPAGVVWRWLLQIAQDRAGFYSYTWLENLARADMPEVQPLVPEYRERALGETIWLARPDRYGGKARVVIAHLVQGRALITVSPEDATLALDQGRAPGGSWGLLLEPIDARRTRLIARSRSPERLTPWLRAVHVGLLEPAHFVMERRMLLTIKRLAEASAPDAGQPKTIDRQLVPTV